MAPSKKNKRPKNKAAKKRRPAGAPARPPLSQPPRPLLPPPAARAAGKTPPPKTGALSQTPPPSRRGQGSSALKKSRPARALPAAPARAEITVSPEAMPIEAGARTALQAYLANVSRIPLLSREEEFRLADHYYKTGDPKAARILIEANLRFVVKTAAEYSRLRVKIMDLIQEGNVGLVRAVQEFNPYKGARIITYAVWWIRGYIQEYLLRRHSIVRLGAGKRQQKLFYLLQREKKRLSELPGTKLLPDLAKKSQSTEKEVERMSQMVLQRDLSLDQPVRRDSGKTFLDLQKDPAPAADETLALKSEEAFLRRELNRLAPSLSKKEREIIQNRLLKSPPDTLRKIAGKFQVSREAIRQTEERLLKKLREKLGPALKKP